MMEDMKLFATNSMVRLILFISTSKVNFGLLFQQKPNPVQTRSQSLLMMVMFSLLVLQDLKLFHKTYALPMKFASIQSLGSYSFPKQL